MTAFAATLGPSAFWYLTRATGAVALLLLTAGVILGVLGTLRFSAVPRWPRFAVDALHRDISLLTIAFVALHVVTSVLDGFAPITLLDGVIPFLSPYRPLWLGLGTVSFDLMLALVLTSLLRRRLGYRSWRAIHWLAYASWPVAVLHGLGTGTDVNSWWMLGLTAACVAAVVVAVLARIGRAEPARSGLRAAALALSVATPIGIVVFALAGPLQRGWARRAGTPARLLTPSTSVPSVQAARPAPAARPLYRRFSATLSGTVSQDPQPDGAIVQLLLRMSGGVSGELRVRLGGTPVGGGGLSMSGSQVDVAAVGMSSALQGQVVSLEGDQFQARVSGASGAVVELAAHLNIDQSADAVTGTLSGGPAGGGAR
jgi:Ferric reductase like transmembrane component